ncbi:hypothetical protein Q8W71_08270 [Methylobacterium sp. NEAU 140]|uniref:hypothetical protein n=1 Tax=Methylobacterium sp. NEAU 140 TaxID=3064945 RepID=UPI0027368790|nr:hypothetical protein [Methylobacterium sp. NEAU 140]MDP4022613.1 hypothetical protein [Methylobacterium sp. NEAU 140]
MSGAAPPSDRAWRGFARALVLTALGLLAGYLALAVLVDPYDTGRVGLLSRGAVRPQGPRTASAVRGRDPAYAGAVIGNSHIQLVEPAELTRLTGVPFVQLSVPATGPAEQFALLGWFLRHHPRPDAIVLAADAFWCADDPAFPSEHPFPFWLVGDWPAYLRGLARFSAAQETVNRIGWLLRAKPKRAAADGWWNYEPDYLRQGFGLDPALKARLDRPVGRETEPHRAGPFPVAARLRAELARVPAATPVVLVFPPVYAAAEPPAGSPRAAAETACRAAIRGALAAHPLSAVVDWRDGRPEARDPDQFFDQSHYRFPVARVLTAEIAADVNRLREGRGH